MKKLSLLCLVLILASSVLAVDVKYTYIDSTCDEEGRGIFYFIIDRAEQHYSADEAKISGIDADWYDCSVAHCGYNYYESPPDAPPVGVLTSGKEFNLITEPMTFMEEKRYTLDFIYPTNVVDGKGYDRDSIYIDLDCPGYDFSCELYDYDVESCQSDGKMFKMYITAEGIDQPHKIDIIQDYRYSIRGPKAQVMDNHPLPEASVKYMRSVNIRPDQTKLSSLGDDRYSIEFPYEDKAEWLTVKGTYCRKDWDRFGKSTNFEFLETMRCDDKSAATPAKTTTTTTTTPAKTTTQIEAQPHKEEPPKQEVTLISMIKAFFDFIFRR